MAARLKAAAALAPLLLLGVAVQLLLSGCREDAAAPGFSGQEKLGYIAVSGPVSRVMITTVAGGAGETYLEWPGSGERFSFSNDGRLFTVVLMSRAGEGPEGRVHSLIATTDGSAAWTIPGNAIRPVFSPDAHAVAFYTMGKPGTQTSTIGVYDIASGKTTTLAHGGTLENPVWIDNTNLVYSNRDDGVIYRLDTRTGASMPLTPPGRRFYYYTFPVTMEQQKIAIVEDGPLSNIWSLDVSSGRLTQVTNNNRYQARAGYLPGTNTILFEEQSSEKAIDSSDLAFINDDGSGFSFLTADFFFDGLETVSPSSGLIAWQHVENQVNSIKVAGRDAKTPKTIVSGTDWYGDPNFAPVAGWQAANPLQMNVESGAPGTDGNPVTVHISNPGSEIVEATLRAFPGLDLALKPAAGSEPDRQDSSGQAAFPISTPGPPATNLVWRISLGSGQSRDLELGAQVRPAVQAASDATMLLTLAVPGTPPRMYWEDFG